ncbi:MAG: hypothetical protein K4571_12480 [Deltaproteobacteria bacterium]
MARLMHGTSSQGMHFSEKEINLKLISAFMHDTGYIQSVDDVVGTCVKYMLVHITRSIYFVQNYYAENTYFAEDMKNPPDVRFHIRRFILCS